MCLVTSNHYSTMPRMTNKKGPLMALVTAEACHKHSNGLLIYSYRLQMNSSYVRCRSEQPVAWHGAMCPAHGRQVLPHACCTADTVATYGEMRIDEPQRVMWLAYLTVTKVNASRFPAPNSGTALSITASCGEPL